MISSSLGVTEHPELTWMVPWCLGEPKYSWKARTPMRALSRWQKAKKTWAAHSGAAVFARLGDVEQTGHSMRETRDILNTNSAARLHPGISANT